MVVCQHLVLHKLGAGAACVCYNHECVIKVIILRSHIQNESRFTLTKQNTNLKYQAPGSNPYLPMR